MSSTNDRGQGNLYPVRCTQCGEIIRERYVSLLPLVMQYNNGDTTESEKKAVFELLGIGANFGSAIMPAAPALFDEEGNITMPSEDMLQPCNVGKAEFTDGEFPLRKMTRIELSVASIIAHFALTNHFFDIYHMLAIVEGEEDESKWDAYCEDLFKLNILKMSTNIDNDEARKGYLRRVLQMVLAMARAEEYRRESGLTSMNTEDLYVGWWVQKLNGRPMPYALAVVGGSGGMFHCRDICCGSCKKQIPFQTGAYKQLIVGLLGSQATGKTTYLAALTDAIDSKEATTLNAKNQEMKISDITISHNWHDDIQWRRFEASDKEGTPGQYWLYKHGFPPAKTNLNADEAVKLNFLLTPADKYKESIQLTIADIPGEAFYSETSGSIDEKYRDSHHKILNGCDAIMMVVSNRQLKKYLDLNAEEAEVEESETHMVTDVEKIVGSYKAYMPEKKIPTAIILTAADEIHGGDLQGALGTAYVPQEVSPLAWSGRSKALVYNAEAMHSLSDAVAGYVNAEFGTFKKALEMYAGEGMVAAFAVSSGTQEAKTLYDEATEKYKAGYELRLAKMRNARFGVTAPLLWFMARQGILDVGRVDDEWNNFSPGMQKWIHKLLIKQLTGRQE